MSNGWTDKPIWRVLLSIDTEMGHEDWLNSNRQGKGQISLNNRNLRGAELRGSELSFSQFKNCDFRGSDITHVNFKNAEFVDCYFDDSIIHGQEFETLIYGCNFDQVMIRSCQFTKTRFNLSSFNSSCIESGNWGETDLDNTIWTDAKVKKVNFQRSHWSEAQLDSAHFCECDFREASFSFASASGTFFDRCDFRDADLKDLSIKDAVFYKCSFLNCLNAPNIKGNYTIIEPDMSINFDGTDLVQPEKLYKQWENTPAKELA